MLRRVGFTFMLGAGILAVAGAVSLGRPLVAEARLSERAWLSVVIREGYARLVVVCVAGDVTLRGIDGFDRVVAERRASKDKTYGEFLAVQVFGRSRNSDGVTDVQLGLWVFLPVALAGIGWAARRAWRRAGISWPALRRELWTAADRRPWPHVLLRGSALAMVACLFLCCSLAWLTTCVVVPYRFGARGDADGLGLGGGIVSFKHRFGQFRDSRVSLFVRPRSFDSSFGHRIPYRPPTMGRRLSVAGFGWTQNIRWPTSDERVRQEWIASGAIIPRLVDRLWFKYHPETPEETATRLRQANTVECFHAVRLPAWFMCTVLAAWPGVAFLRGPYRRAKRRARGLCVACGYNLTGLPEPRCPECGHRAERSKEGAYGVCD